MRVLFDVSGLDHERISGVGTYVRHLSAGLRRLQGVELVGSYRLSRRAAVDVMARNFNGPLTSYWPWWSDYFTRGFDVFHGPDFRLPKIRGLARVVTIHDLAFYHPGYMGETFARTRRQIVDRVLGGKGPEAVIAVSEFTAKEILGRFPHLEGRVHTVWHGADHMLVPANRGPRPMVEPYFLFVGNLESRKNIVGLIQAFDLLKERAEHRHTRLVLIGKEGFGYEAIMMAAKSARSRDHIVFPGFIPNIGLVNYYQWAEAFVFPSWYEGFGFPILEAMRLGCPVITANATATAEVAGTAAVLVDPAKVEEIAHAMAGIMADRRERERLIGEGLARGSNVTWSKCAEQTKEVYERAMARRRESDKFFV